MQWRFAHSPVTLTLCALPPLTLITKCSLAAAGLEFFRVWGKRALLTRRGCTSSLEHAKVP